METLPTHLQSLINKRRTYVLEFLGAKRKTLRIDVYMQWLKDFTNKFITLITKMFWISLFLKISIVQGEQ